MKKIIAGIFLFVVFLGLGLASPKSALAFDTWDCAVNWTIPNSISANQNVTIGFNAITSSTDWSLDQIKFLYDYKEIPIRLTGTYNYAGDVNSGADGSLHRLQVVAHDRLGHAAQGCLPLESFITGYNDPNPSCNLDKKYPPLSTDCVACVYNRLLPESIQTIKGPNPTCNSVEVVSHLCKGGVSTDATNLCTNIQTKYCSTECGYYVAPSPSTVPTAAPTLPPGATATTAPTGNSPTCTLTGPSTASTGQAVTFTATGTGNGRNVMMTEIYVQKPNTPGLLAGDFIQVASNQACNSQTCTVTGTYTFDTAYNVPVTCNAFYQTQFTGNKADECSGTLAGVQKAGSGWSDCGAGGRINVAVTAVTKTSFYRVSDKAFQATDTGGNAPEWQPYTEEPTAFDYLFKNAKPGDALTLFAQFQADNGQTSAVFQKSIKYIGEDPKITSIACTYDPSGTGTSITINGFNFGSEQGNGTVTLPSEKLDANVLSWGSEEIPPTVNPSVTGNISPTVTGTSEPTPTPTSTSTPTLTPTLTPIPTLPSYYGVGALCNPGGCNSGLVCVPDSRVYTCQRAVQLDSGNVSKASGITDLLKWNHAVSAGNNKILIVSASYEGPEGYSPSYPTITKITYGGRDLTKKISLSNYRYMSDIWYLVNPPEGTAEIAITKDGNGMVFSIMASATTWFNVDQGYPFGTAVSDKGVTNNPTVDIFQSASSSMGDMVIDNLSTYIGSSVTAGSGQTKYYEANSANGHGIGSYLSGASTMSWTKAGGNGNGYDNKAWALVAVPLKIARVSAPATLGASTVKSKIVARVDTKLAEGRHNILVTRSDGKVAKVGTCNIGLTTVDFTQKTACLANAGTLAVDNVAVDITEKADKAKSLIKTKIKIDADGKPTGFTPKLEIGKSYILTIRAPKTVSRKVEFVAEEGTTNLDDIILPVGDIYPVASPDNKINAFDKAEMTREWSIITDVTRAADLNNDSRVNSVDYSCLQNNYNKSGD